MIVCVIIALKIINVNNNLIKLYKAVKNMAIITVICSGMMGSAITFPAAHNGHTIRLVGSPLDTEIIKHGQKTGEHLTLSLYRKNNDTNGTDEPFVMPGAVTFHYFEEMEECIKGADLIICGVSSFGMDWFCENVIPKLPEETPLLSISKGMIDDGENKGHLISYPEYMQRFTDKKLRIYAVGGPCTSYELAVQDPTEVVFCGPDIETLRWIKELFETDYYHISLSTDVHGVECAVALKNAYALGIALAIGLSYKREGKALEHYNSQAGLFMQASREMYLLLDAFDSTAERNIFVGVGDLYVTVYGGRNRKLGMLLGQGYTYKQAMEKLTGITMEGVVISRRTAKAVEQLAEIGKINLKDFPLLRHIKELLEDDAVVNIPWKEFENEYEG